MFCAKSTAFQSDTPAQTLILFNYKNPLARPTVWKKEKEKHKLDYKLEWKFGIELEYIKNMKRVKENAQFVSSCRDFKQFVQRSALGKAPWESSAMNQMEPWLDVSSEPVVPLGHRVLQPQPWQSPKSWRYTKKFEDGVAGAKSLRHLVVSLMFNSVLKICAWINAYITIID